MRLVDEIAEHLPRLQIVHGPELIVGNTMEDIKSEGGKFADLFSLLRLGIRYDGRRLVDILMMMDTDHTQTVTVKQFMEALAVRLLDQYEGMHNQRGIFVVVTP